ncbi:MAG: sulfite exporter TauE/SafE family protein [Armatimonadota bacterium]
MTAALLWLAATGVLVGLAGGLLGVGGCFIMVPVQVWAFQAMGVPLDIAVKQAFGTNLLVVLPTALSGALGHTRKGAVLWRAGVILGLGGAAGAVVGAAIATHLPGATLKVIFGLAIVASAIRMLRAKPPKVEPHPEKAAWKLLAWAIPIGVLTGLIGIGGGVLMVPIMVLALGFSMHQAVGTSTAMMLFTAAGGCTSYIAHGMGVEGLPPYSIGYVNLAAWAALALTSVPMAQVGVKVAHLLDQRRLKLVFIIVMIYMGLKMIGVFTWLGLPL